MASGFTIKQDNLSKIMKAVGGLTSKDVYVGFPDSNPARNNDPPSPITNAEIAFINEHGSPAANIPARPFMIPGAMSILSQAQTLLQKAAIAALEGQPAQSDVFLNQLGLLGVSAVQRAITRGQGWKPLAPMTIAMRKARGRTGTHPLIDTGQLRQHVQYVIRPSGKYKGQTIDATTIL